MLNLTVTWKRIWYNRFWWSPYERGEIRGQDIGINKIYRHKKSGQVRLYSNIDFNGAKVRINGQPFVTMRKRGRFGKLYLGFKED